jgi:excisionase family DNA binding protein
MKALAVAGSRSDRAVKRGIGRIFTMKLTPTAAAVRAGVSPKLIYRWCQERRLPHYRLGTQGHRGRILIEDSDLDTFLDSCRVEAFDVADDEPLKHIR